MDYSKIRATWFTGTCYHLEQLNAITSSTDIRSYAFIMHDKDKQDNGELKKPHYHFLVQFYQTQRGAWFKAFASDDMGFVFYQPCYAPQGAYDYLIHDTPTARKQKKHLYDASERTSTIDTFETEDKPDENDELYADLMELLNHQITWYEFIKKKPKRIHMIANIKVAYDLLHFEIYGFRYFDQPNYRANKTTGEVFRQPPPKPPQPKAPTPKIELVPIENDEDLPF